MLSFLYEIHFWTFSDININNNDFGAFKYHCKKENCSSLLQESKRLYACHRNYKWILSNKKSPKLRQNVKELEENISAHRIVNLKWIARDYLIIFFNSGTIAYIHINVSTGDLGSITFDKNLRDKLSSLHISDLITTSVFSICCFNDPRLVLIQYGKPSFKNPYKKISDLEPRFTFVNLPGPVGRRLRRKLSLNKTGDVIAVWWKYCDDDVFPWSPLVKDVDRANVHIFRVNGSKVEFLCHYRTQYDVMSVVFSSIEPRVLFTVEQKISGEGNIYAEITTFEIVKYSRLKKLGVVAIFLQSEVCCLEFSPDRSNLLLGCTNGSLVLYNQSRASTLIAWVNFIPSIMKWNGGGYLAAVGSIQGQVQCFDSALNDIEMQCVGEDISPSSVIDLSTYFEQSTSQTPSLVGMEWNLKRTKKDSVEFQDEDEFLLLSFANGPLVILRIFHASEISPEFLVSQYLRMDQFDKAINFLLSLDWDANPSVCCSLFKKISNSILTSSAFSVSEKHSKLQVVLDSFYSPVRPISNSVESEFYEPMRNISRRLFHYFLRHDLSDEAMMIANRLNEHDLFMDLYHYANASHNSSLASLSWGKAEKILAEDEATDPSSGSENCDCSCSNCSCESDGDTNHSPESRLRNSQKLPTPIMVSSSNRASFATITRVNSTTSSLESSSVKNNSEETTQSPSDRSTTLPSLDRNQPHLYPKDTSVIRSISNLSPSIESVLNSPSTSGIPNSITKDLLHQAGLSESKIKVIHFGVV